MSSILGLLVALLFLTLVLHVVARVLRVPVADESRQCRAWLPTHWREPLEEGEEVRFESRDGVTLNGTFLARLTDESHGVVVFSHEWNGDRWNALPYVEHLRSEGFDVFTFDYRNHRRRKQASRHNQAFQVMEADLADLHAAIAAAISRSAHTQPRVAVIGVGKGAAVALGVAVDEPAVRALVLDSVQPLPERTPVGESRARSGWWHGLIDEWIPHAAPPACDLNQVVPLVRVPVLLVQGRKDALVSLDGIRNLASAIAGQCQLWIVPGARRAEAVHVERNAYRRRTARFLLQSLRTKPATPREPSRGVARVPLAQRNPVSYGSAR